MCGICGIIEKNNHNIDIEVLKSMNFALLHRGPDEEGYFVDKNVALAMRRLSIIDLSTGKQPIFNEDQTLALVFNGEIYNFYELRDELIKKGHLFRTTSDTEVIIHLYEEEKENFPKKLRGMFAIALVDLKEKKLILTRDRFGKKPIYYFNNQKAFAFSSELNSLSKHPAFKKDINLNAINLYLSLQYIPSPYTVYEDVFKLEPATILVLDFKGNIIKKEKYWSLNKTEAKISFEEAKDKLIKLLFEAVRLRMVADVEIGAFLSGGIDSSIVVGIMSKLSSKPIKTFSIGFKEEKFSELNYAKKVAEKFSTQHTELIVTDNMIDIVEDLPIFYGEPFADPSALPTYYVSKITSKYLKVALNGDGGDEAFGGYTRYVFIRMIEKLKKFGLDIPAAFFLRLFENINEGDAPFDLIWKLKKAAKALSTIDIENVYISSISFFDPFEKERYLSKAFKEKTIDLSIKYLKEIFSEIDGDILRKASYLDYHSYLPECLMTKMDRASMINSLETRSPFLDHILVEFAFSLPSNYKIKGIKTKHILKEAFSDILPKEVKSRGKMGFGIPLGPWFRKELKKVFEENCIRSGFIDRGYFKKDELLKLWQDHINFKKDNGYRLWAILILELWHKKYLNEFKL